MKNWPSPNPVGSAEGLAKNSSVAAPAEFPLTSVPFGLAAVLTEALSRWRAPMDFPMQYDISLDWRVFVFAAAGSLIAGGLFGSAPAWRASKSDPNMVLRGASATWGRSRLAFRDVLVVVDPVIVSSSGTALLDAPGVDVLRRDLLPNATIVTPNRTKIDSRSRLRM